MIAKLRELFGYRELIESLVLRDLKVRYKNSVLGFLWSLVNPLLLMTVFTVVFTVMLPNMTIPKFPVFVLCALLPWNFFSTSIVGAVNSIVQNGHLIKKVYFPREVLPIALVFSNFVNFLLAMPILFAFLIIFRVPFTLALLYLPLIMAVQVIFTIGVALVLATLNVFYRDTAVIMEVLKKFQGRSAQSTNTGNLGMVMFGSMTVNTTVNTVMSSSGLTSDHRNPSTEFL